MSVYPSVLLSVVNVDLANILLQFQSERKQRQDNELELNHFIPEFLKWTLPFLNLDLSTDGNMDFSLKLKTQWQTV